MVDETLCKIISEKTAGTVCCDRLCEIRKCALNKDVSTCGDCSELETCPTIRMILENNPFALENLKL